MMKNINGLSEINAVEFDSNKRECIANILETIMNASVHKESNRVKYYRIPVGFDTETSTYGDHSYIYIWQMTVGETTYYGRQWRDFIDILKAIAYRIEYDIIIGIANSGFDMSFYDIPLTILANREGYSYSQINSSPHHPVLCEFRRDRTNKKEKIGSVKILDVCKISGLSLEKIGKNFCKHKKLTGYLDYTKVRTPETPLRQHELMYCLYDPIVVAEYLEYLYSNFSDKGKKFPVTVTSVIRNDIKEEAKDSKYKSLIDKVATDLYPAKVKDYDFIMKYLFKAGYTHANKSYVNKVITNVTCVDYTSSYPAELVSQKFPMEKFHEVDDFKGKYKCAYSTIKSLKFEQDMAYILLVNFSGIRAKYQHTVESVHKIVRTDAGNQLCKGLVSDNGKILYAEKVQLCLTELDFDIIRKFYYADSIEILTVVKAKKEYLPSYVLVPMINAYKNKAILKQNEMANTPEYFVEKGKVNSAFGCCVQKLNLDEDSLCFDYNDDMQEVFEYRHTPVWKKLQTNSKYAENDENTLKQIAYCQAKRHKILSCYWGIWCTSYARYKLLTMLWEVEQKSANCVVYCDTDSLYIKNIKTVRDIIDKWNTQTIQKNKHLCKECHDLNTLDIDDTCLYFKTLGAKRYVKSYFGKDKELKTVATIAGLKKGTLEKSCGYDRELIYQTFTNKMFMDKTMAEKLAPCYDYTEYSDMLVDYMGNSCECSQYGGCTLKTVEFTLTMTEEYLKILEGQMSSTGFSD